jgi:hypothetical protein
MRNISHKRCIENQTTLFKFENVNFLLENLADDEVICENIVQPDRPPITA